MNTSLFRIAGPASQALIFNQTAVGLGFGSIGEIDQFIFSTYSKAIRNIRPADRLRGAIFVLEPASIAGATGDPLSLKPLLMKIQSSTTSTFHSLRIDLTDGLGTAYTCTPTDRNNLVNGEWSQLVAQQFSQLGKCVVWAIGVGVFVYICGNLYLESADVIEEFPAGLPGSFQNLSWDDGKIVFEFADSNLNDRGPVGIWQLPSKNLLRPRPEALIRSRLGEFLRYRLALYRHHDEEAHVENEGRADISLHLIDDRVLIVEVKWIGCSLVGTHVGATEDQIKKAISKNTAGWLTKFDDSTITSGVRQLVRYYKTGRYRRAYLAVFDCRSAAKINNSCNLPDSASDLSGHSAVNFRVLRACVDPRPASKRSRS